MEKEQEIPQHIVDYYKSTNNSVLNPTTIRTRNVTKLGVDTLIEKNGFQSLNLSPSTNLLQNLFQEHTVLPRGF